jgi:Chlorophyll A-B binding protein
MLAVVGFVVPEFVRIPGDQFSFAAVPRDALPQSMIQIFAWISFVEAVSFPALANMNEYDRQPGNFGFDPLRLYPTDPTKRAEMELKELKNGRLAMVAIGGMVAQSVVSGHGFPYLP